MKRLAEEANESPPTKTKTLEKYVQVVLPSVKPEAISSLNKNLQHGYMIEGNDMKKIPGYSDFKVKLTSEYKKKEMNKLGSDGKRHTRSQGGGNLSNESYGGIDTDFFNYGNPWLKDHKNNMTDNEFFPMHSDLGKEYVQVDQSSDKYWNKDIDEFVCYFTKHYVHIYDEYKDLMPYSICSLTYKKECSRTPHNDPKAYEAIVGFNFEGCGGLKLLSYTDTNFHKHAQQILQLDTDDCYLMLGHSTCRERKHAVDNCTKGRFVHLIKYIHKEKYLTIIKEKIGKNNEKKEALEAAVENLFKAILSCN